MAETVAVPGIAHPRSESQQRLGGWLLAAAGLALWYVPINQLRIEWSINPQYAYGWVVPFLALYLFGERWKDRPAPDSAGTRWSHAIVALSVGLLLFPARLIEEATPDWRLVSWVLALTAVLLTLEAVTYAGGRPWLRHFAFPVCFFLVSVPWPVPFEHAVVQQLMHGVAGICVDALGFWGIPAVQQGNVIQIGSGVVGVEEACSGVRSLQTTLMIALFLGELFRFAKWRRVVLLIAGLLVAFAFNAARAFVLTYVYNSKGQQGFTRYHDSVGLSVLILSLAALAFLAWLLKGPHKAVAPASRQPARTIPAIALILLLAWAALAEAGTELWYHIHEAGVAPVAWNMVFPEQQPGFHEIQIPDLTAATLRYNQGRAAGWEDDTGNRWTMFFLRWLPGRASVQLARSHGPEICLPAAGLTMRSDLGVSTWDVDGVSMAAHTYVFSANGHTLYVFFCLAEDHGPTDGPASTFQDMTKARRMDAVLAGRRNRGQQMLEITLSGPLDEAEARNDFTQFLSQSLRKPASEN